jgi:hypothetical protein
MRHAKLWAFAVAALLSPAAIAPAAGQTYNPYISIDAVERPKKPAKKGKSSAYPRMAQPPAGTSSTAAKKKPPPEFDYDDDDLPAGSKEKRRPRLRSR